MNININKEIDSKVNIDKLIYGQKVNIEMGDTIIKGRIIKLDKYEHYRKDSTNKRAEVTLDNGIEFSLQQNS